MKAIVPSGSLKLKCGQCGWHLICPGGGDALPPFHLLFDGKCPKCGGKLEHSAPTRLERLNPIEKSRAAYHRMKLITKKQEWKK